MNSPNETFYPLSYWFDLFAYSYIFDSLFFFVLTPISLISLCLKIIAFRVLNKSQFLKSKFFCYMKSYVLNGILQSVIIMTTFTMNTHSFFEFTNTYEALFYGIYIYFCVISGSLLFSSFLEILMVIERLFYFLPTRFKCFKYIQIKIVLLATLILTSFMSATSGVATCMLCDARASPKIATPKFFFINLTLFRAFFISI